MMQSMFREHDLSISQKLAKMNWWLVFLIFCLAGIGTASLYSAAGGSFDPWASRQLVRFGVGVVGMLIITLIDIRWWYRLAWPIYFIGIILLIFVEVKGHVGMGAQRWIDLGFMTLQPSELVKITVIMALARYFHGSSPEQVRRISFLIIPALVIAVPVGLVLLQPDLGTSLMIVMAGAGMVFIAGAPLRLFVGSGILAAISIPIGWQFLHEYQKQRVISFINPESEQINIQGLQLFQNKFGDLLATHQHPTENRAHSRSAENRVCTHSRCIYSRKYFFRIFHNHTFTYLSIHRTLTNNPARRR